MKITLIANGAAIFGLLTAVSGPVDAATNDAPVDAQTTNQTAAVETAKPAMSEQDAADEARRKAAFAEAAAKLAAEPKVEKTDYNAFRLLLTRNIFDPYRRPPVQRSNTPTIQIDYFTLCGTSSYDDQSVAIFDGNNRQYRGTFKIGGSIAGYKIVKVRYDSVDLQAGTNQPISLPVLAQMRRIDRGPWNLTTNPLPASGSASSDSGVSAAIPGGVDEVTRKMMERHAAEMLGK